MTIKKFSAFNMLRRRLFLQIYLTVIASLVLVVILSGLVWGVFGRERSGHEFFETAGRLVSQSLPEASAPKDQQQAAIETYGRELDFKISLYDEADRLIATFGDPRLPPPRATGKSGLHRASGGPIMTFNLPDGRWLVVDPVRRDRANPLVNLIIMLVLVAVCVALAAYPLVRRLTKRLESLQQGVERIGSGDLSARVAVRGGDEVAQLATSFNAAAEKIERLVEAHRLLLANASHELRTPLSRIRLGLELQQDNPTQDRRDAMKQDIGELDALIDEILLLSRLDSGAQFDLNQSVDLVGLTAEECAHYENCSLSGNPVEVRGDPRLLHRLVGNLLENASKHGMPPIEITIAATADMAEIIVSDAGPGIGEEDREKIFQPFFRGSGRQNIEGYGLGLALVRQIARAHGGTAELVDRASKESAVKIVLPRHRS